MQWPGMPLLLLVRVAKWCSGTQTHLHPMFMPVWEAKASTVWQKKGQKCPTPDLGKTQKLINSWNVVSECTGHQRRFSAACWGTSQAQRSENSLKFIWSVSARELCQENYKPSLSRTGQNSCPLGLPPLLPAGQAGKALPHSFPAQSLSSHVSCRHAGVDIILRLTGDQAVTLGYPCTLFAAPRMWRPQ